MGERDDYGFCTQTEPWAAVLTGTPSCIKHLSVRPLPENDLAELLHEIEKMKDLASRTQRTLDRVESLARRLAHRGDAEGRSKAAGPANSCSTPYQTLLTAREQEVFWLIGKGYTPKEIGGLLSVSIKTVGSHSENIKNKLSMENSAELREAARRAVAGGDRPTGDGVQKISQPPNRGISRFF